MSRVSGNDTVSYLHLADLFWGRAICIVRGVGQIFDGDVTTAMCNIAKNGTKGEVSLYKLLLYDGRVIALNVTLDEDAAAIGAGLIVWDGTVNDGSDGSGGSVDVGLALDEDATATEGCIARDGAVSERERADISDTAAGAICHIARDNAVVQREYAAIEDTAAAATEGCVARDGAIVQREYAFVGDAAAAAVAIDKGCVAWGVAWDSATVQCEGALVIDEARDAGGTVAVLEGETENGRGDSLDHTNTMLTRATTDREETFTGATNNQVLRDGQITTGQ